MIVKAGLGLIGLSAISVGGVAVTKPHWLGMKGDHMPDYHPLFKDTDYANKEASDYGTSKFGGKYKHYLVGVTTKKGDDTKTNEKWWEWSFERLKEDKPKSKKFKYEDKKATDAVTTWYSQYSSGDHNKALNSVCKAAYKAAAEKITADGTGDDEYKEADVWKYCSVLGEKPKTVVDREENTKKYKTNNTIGNDSGSASKLVSTTGNDKFWEIRDKEFKKEDGYGNIEETNDAFFKKDGNTIIRDLCEKAYSLEGATEGNGTAQKPTKEKTIKYCSLDKQ